MSALLVNKHAMFLLIVCLSALVGKGTVGARIISLMIQGVAWLPSAWSSPAAKMLQDTVGDVVYREERVSG